MLLIPPCVRLLVASALLFLLRTEAPGAAGKLFQAAGVALPPTIRQVS